MDLLIATWTLRLAIVAAAAVGAMSIYVGTPVLDSVDRALAVAVGFTLAGRWFVSYLEPPERRLLRMRVRREARRRKQVKSKSGAAGAPAGSTISRTA